MLLSATACQEDAESPSNVNSQDAIAFRLGEEDISEPCSAIGETRSFMLLSEDVQDTLLVSRSVSMSRCEDLVKGSTRGVPVTTDNLVANYDGNVGIAAYYPESPYNEYIPASKLKHDSGNIWKIMDGESSKEYPWVVGDLQFWAWAPKTLEPTIVGPKATFTYSMPAPGGTGADAEAMTDILLTDTRANSRTEEGYAPLHLKHALSALRFQIGKTNACTIKSITLKNLYSEANCTYTSGETEPFSWTGFSSEKTNDYTQLFGDAVQEYLIDDDNVQSIGTPAKTFMVIPQTSNDDHAITLEVVYCLTGNTSDVILSTVLTADVSNWKAGYTYTYTLSITNGLDIEIDDKVEGSVKSNLEIKNVGGLPAYIRVLLTGDWVDPDDNNAIVCAWSKDDATVGTFEGMNTDDWILGTDGFYYYKHILPAGATIPADKALFTSYTVSNKPSALAENTELEFNVVSQAVVAENGKASITAAWGETAAEYVEPLQ